ncbi:MAG TPA: S8 family serine peptidase [Kofleriaceae bacterium]|jgi:subtilase family serine protease|nr:S8 family serine peptidase [Kofleriaceae bacterium]
MKLTTLRSALLQSLPFAFAAFTAACAVDDGQPTTTMTDDEIRTAPNIRVCNDGNEVQCHARVLVDAYGNIRANATPAGFSPAQLRSFYGITSTGSTSTTVAIVDSNGYPNALRDLQMYRSTFGLPAISACSSGTHPCLAVVNQNGAASPLPATNVGWDQETALDLDMVSAMCPNCNILLIQGTSASFANLATAANTAASSTAAGSRPVAISNSYGGGESGTTSLSASYTHAGIAVTASSGDSGFQAGPQFPATSPGVIAVGGTSVHMGATPRETVWKTTTTEAAGSGCSTVFAKPSWQHDSGCARRMEADVSAVADPNTGVAVFAPTSTTASSFQVFGGTSVAAPLIAGIIGSTGAGIDPQTIYARVAANPGLVFDVTSGNNGTCSASTPYFCTAETGFDGPTGLGSPVGPGAF